MFHSIPGLGVVAYIHEKKVLVARVTGNGSDQRGAGPEIVNNTIIGLELPDTPVKGICVLEEISITAFR